MRFLRKYIRAILLEEVDQNPDPDGDDKKKQPPEDLLIEPDMPEEKEKDQKEASAVSAGSAPSGAIRGSTSPLGTDSTYPSKKRRKKQKPSPSGGSDWYLPTKK